MLQRALHFAGCGYMISYRVDKTDYMSITCFRLQPIKIWTKSSKFF